MLNICNFSLHYECKRRLAQHTWFVPELSSMYANLDRISGRRLPVADPTELDSSAIAEKNRKESSRWTMGSSHREGWISTFFRAPRRIFTRMRHWKISEPHRFADKVALHISFYGFQQNSHFIPKVWFQKNFVFDVQNFLRSAGRKCFSWNCDNFFKF